MELLFYLVSLAPALLIFQAIPVWWWLRRWPPDSFSLRVLWYLTSTVSAIAGVLLFAGLFIGGFWYLRSSSDVCGGEVTGPPVSTFFPLQKRCYLADGSVVDLVPASLSMAITIFLLLTLVLGGATWAAYGLGRNRLRKGRGDGSVD